MQDRPCRGSCQFPNDAKRSFVTKIRRRRNTTTETQRSLRMGTGAPLETSVLPVSLWFHSTGNDFWTTPENGGPLVCSQANKRAAMWPSRARRCAWLGSWQLPLQVTDRLRSGALRRKQGNGQTRKWRYLAFFTWLPALPQGFAIGVAGAVVWIVCEELAAAGSLANSLLRRLMRSCTIGLRFSAISLRNCSSIARRPSL